MRCVVLIALGCVVPTMAYGAEAAQNPGTPEPLPIVMLHPFTAQYYRCAEHPDGELPGVGDALGQDCAIVKTRTGFAGEGLRNEDYDSWNEPLLAPVSGKITRVRVNPETNVPGTLGKPPASTITFENEDGVSVIYAHVQDIQVKVGDRVSAGQVVARVGNNGMSRSPHLHVGAWAGKQPYQIRWDLRALGTIRRAARATAQTK